MLSTNRVVTNNSFGIVEKLIPAGRCAVLRHVGSDDNLREVVNYLYVEMASTEWRRGA